MADVNQEHDPIYLHKVMLQNIIQNLFQHHQALTNAIRILPINEQVKHSILYSIGCGYLWAKDAIEAFPLVKPEGSSDGVEPLPNAE